MSAAALMDEGPNDDANDDAAAGETVGSSSDLPMTPAERTFRSHLGRAEFLAGVAAGRWRPVSLDWPTAVFGVAAAARDNSPGEFFIRFNLDDYPGTAPQGQPWDIESDVLLPVARRPKGDRVGTAFREGEGLYLPIDRSAVGGHTDWRMWRWNDTRDIAFYLRLVHKLLNDEDYQGV